MALEDLDLEFEDEEEAKKKKSEAVHVDVDLEFSTPGGSVTPRAATPRPAPVKASTSPNIKRPQAAPVKNIAEARASAPKRPMAATAATPVTQPGLKVMGATVLKEDLDDLESQEVLELREHVKQVQYQADLKVAMAEFKTELLTELLSDMKLMEHQIGQLLVRINAKHPDLKQEALMIKKILADFTSKKRK